MMKKLRATLALLALSLCGPSHADTPELAAAALDDFAQGWYFTAALTHDTAPWSTETPPLRADAAVPHARPAALVVPATPVPEPGGATMLLVGLALICFGVGAGARQRGDTFSG